MPEFVINPKSEDREKRLTEVVQELARRLQPMASRTLKVESVRIGTYDECDEWCDCEDDCDCDYNVVRIVDVEEARGKFLFWEWIKRVNERVIFTISSDFLDEEGLPEALNCTIASGIDLRSVRDVIGAYADEIGVPKVVINQDQPE